MADRWSGPTPGEVLLARTLRRAAQIRRRRRLASGAAVAAVAAVAIGVPAATLGSGGGRSRLQVGAPPTRPVTGGAAAVPPPHCSTSQMSVSYDHSRDGALVGVSEGQDDDGTTLVLTNAGPTTCEVAGTPAVDPMLASGGEGAGPASEGPGADAVVLRPGQSAGSTLRWYATGDGSGGAGLCALPVEGLSISLAGWTGRLTVPWYGGDVLCGLGITPSALAAVGAPTTSSAGPMADGLCTTRQLQWLYLPHVSDLSSDPGHFFFEVVNVSGSACSTGDYPGASASSADGSPLVISEGRADIGGRPSRLRLPPGGVASFALTLPDTPGATCETLGAFYFIAPDDRAQSPAVAVSGATGVAPRTCSDRTVISDVGPLHAGVAFALGEAARRG